MKKVLYIKINRPWSWNAVLYPKIESINLLDCSHSYDKLSSGKVWKRNIWTDEKFCDCYTNKSQIHETLSCWSFCFFVDGRGDCINCFWFSFNESRWFSDLVAFYCNEMSSIQTKKKMLCSNIDIGTFIKLKIFVSMRSLH